jgi:cytochrome P450
MSFSPTAAAVATTILQKLVKFFGAITATLIIYQTIWWKYCQYRMHKMGYPVVPLEYPWLSMFGTIFLARREWSRIYDVKVELMQKLNSKTASIPTPWWNPRCTINTADPELVKFILKDEFNVFLKTTMLICVLKDLLGNGIFATNHGPLAPDGGQNWLVQRKTASKIFTRNQFQDFMYTVFNRHGKKLCHILDDKIALESNSINHGSAQIEMQSYMFRYTMDSIGVIGFGQELETLSSDSVPFADAFDRAQKLVAYRFLTPYWYTPLGRMLYSNEREIARHVKTLDDFAFQVIETRRKQIEEKGVEREDILSLFMKEQLQLSDRDLRDVVMSFLIAGRDTTACCLIFSLYLLAKHPEIQQKARLEVQEQIPADMDGDRIPNVNDLTKLKIIWGIVMESLRLYPPVPTDVKELFVHDVVLPNGHKAPIGTSISFEPYVMGRLKEFWGLDAEEFRPDRWLAQGFQMPTPYEFPNFQAGPRSCLGESMAKFEAQLVLCLLLNRYRFELANPEIPVTYAVGLTMSVKGGLHLKVSKLVC